MILCKEDFQSMEKRLHLSDVNIPIFVVSTLKDHVAPWKSVYKIHDFTKSDIRFVLTSGGHNAGIVSEPGHPHRAFQMYDRSKEDKRMSPVRWQKEAPSYEGSWWPEWHNWLSSHSGSKGEAPMMGNPKAGLKPLCDAPGTYVLVRY